MTFKTLLCVSMAWVSTLLIAQSALPQLWNDTTQRLYNEVLNADKSLATPWTIKSIQVLQKVQQGTATNEDLEALLNAYDREQRPARECAEAIVLLYTLRDNQKDLFLKDYSLFQEDFPHSEYTPLVAPKDFLKRCPKCKGKSAKKTNCKSCRNTKVCATCKGKGHHLFGGMRRTQRRYTSTSFNDSNSSSRSSHRKLSSHRSNNYGNSYIKEFSADAKETPCVTCHGTGICTTCNQPKKGNQCPPCNTSGYIPEGAKIGNALKTVATKGIQIISNIKNSAHLQWETTAAFKEEFQKLRAENDLGKLIERVNALIAQYPQAAQRQSCNRFLGHLSILQGDTTKFLAEQQRYEAQVAELQKAIKDAERDNKSYYRRKEALLRLAERFPKLSYHADLKVAIRLCEDEINRQEDDLKNALALLEAVEDYNVGIQRANLLLEEIDPVSPLQSAISTVREDFIARKKKADRHRQYLYVAVGLGVLVLIYFLFDILYGIYQTNKNRR